MLGAPLPVLSPSYAAGGPGSYREPLVPLLGEAVRTRRLQPAGEPSVAPDGLTRLGADAPADQLAVRMLPRISSPAPHKGLRLVRAEVRGKLTVTDPKTFVGALTRPTCSVSLGRLQSAMSTP